MSEYASVSTPAFRTAAMIAALSLALAPAAALAGKKGGSGEGGGGGGVSSPTLTVGGSRELTIGGDGQGLQVNVSELFIGGKCQAAFSLFNAGSHSASIYMLAETLDASKRPVDNWVIEKARLDPGESKQMIFSCSAAQYLNLRALSNRGWPPANCVSCPVSHPVPVKVSANLVVLPQ
ncbi:MAG: hypothetical protein ACM31L_19340 [Actinomycetota bacterium]